MCRRLVAALGVLLALAAKSGAQPTIDSSASILFMPLVAGDANQDTLIQINNTGNSAVFAECFFVAGDSCIETNFVLSLKARQPTHWVASRGRPTNADDPACSPANFDCDGAGLDPGVPTVPPVPDGFRGFLVCVETLDGHVPSPGNHLAGEATIVEKATGALTQYTAVGLAGQESSDGNATLCLGGQGSTTACPNGAEYDGCPDTWIVNFLPDGAADPIVGGTSSVNTHLVILPCARNFDTGEVAGSVIQYLWFSEHASRASTSGSVGCWADLQISHIDTHDGTHSALSAEALGNGGAQIRLRAPGAGIIVLPYEIHHSDAHGDATVVTNAHAEGMRTQPDLLVLPMEPTP